MYTASLDFNNIINDSDLMWICYGLDVLAILAQTLIFLEDLLRDLTEISLSFMINIMCHMTSTGMDHPKALIQLLLSNTTSPM